MFKQNEGILDRIVRVTLGLVLLPTGLFLLGGLQGSVLGLVVAGISGLPLITGITGFCPLYVPFGINTLEKEKELIARCRSMASGFRSGGFSCAGPMCGPGPQSIENTQNEQG